MTRTEPISYVEATIRALEEDNAELLAEIERLRAELKTANANCDRMANLAIDNAKDTLRLRAALEGIAANTYGYEPLAMSDEEAKDYFANLFFAAQGKARAALAQPAAPEERRTGLRLVMVAATLLDQEDLPDEPSAILCGSIDAIRSLGGLLGDTVDVLPAQPAAPGGDK